MMDARPRAPVKGTAEHGTAEAAGTSASRRDPESGYQIVERGPVRVTFSETLVSFDMVHWYVWRAGMPLPRPMALHRSRYRRRRRGR